MISKEILTKQEVIDLVTPYAEKIYDKIFLGFEDYLRHDLKQSHIHNNTVKANLIRSYIINRIKELVVEEPLWRWVEKNRMICVVIEGKIWLRYKKLNKSYLTQNVTTTQVSDFRNQAKTESNIRSRYINIDVGWYLNDFYTEIENVYIVCPDNKRNAWKVVFKPQGMEKGKTIPLFSDSDEEQENQIQIAHIKPQFKKQKNKSDEANQ
jgi:hypothetical protein